MARPRLVYPPPSERHIAAIRVRLQQCDSLEVAAALSGVPRKHLIAWVEAGRRGDPEYVKFIDMIDEENAKLSANVLERIYEEAFENKNFAALTFLYNNRLKRHEERMAKKLEEIEDRIEAEEAAGGTTKLSEEELQALEEKVAAQNDAEDRYH